MDFWENPKYQDSEQPLRAWFAEVKAAAWNCPNDIKEKYKSASRIGKNRAVFNLKGNTYRLVVAIRYEYKLVFIRFIGTHQQYDKINAPEI